MSEPTDHDDDVSHLVELGYVDPLAAEAHQAASRAAQEAALRRALELRKEGRGAEAAPILEKLLDDDPAWVAPRRALAEYYYSVGRHGDAQAQLDWLTCHAVESPSLSLLAGALAIARRDLRAAVDLLEYAAYAEPARPGVDALLGTALLRAGRFDDAIRSFEAALAHDPHDARALDGMATVSLRQSNYEQAADWALRALEHDLDLFRPHYTLGVALAHMGRVSEALHALETAARIEPRRAAPYFWLERIARRHPESAARSAVYRRRSQEIVKLRRALREQAALRAKIEE